MYGTKGRTVYKIINMKKVLKTKKKLVKKVAKKVVKEKPIGKVTHYYGGIGVAIVKFYKAVKKEEKVCFYNSSGEFDQVIGSMQFDHKDIVVAKKGQEVGIKVDQKVREGDEIYAAK